MCCQHLSQKGAKYTWHSELVSYNIISAEQGHYEIVEHLLGYGADNNGPPVTTSGRTALQAAVNKGYRDIERMLLSYLVEGHAQPTPYLS
ncbi:hypothetical protein N7471_010593 [Penicillium samsonianum]|uniref:uncharacterized protein n=1 Tax=Penicillium samsonianum TaxID=1882272 RepID=UPI00254887AA|nr:uncharacterized protein N7471_010593 [Penicillium samsonianum]KAJ6126100.1 hypothetical protein N7471_010593 [Penicillium samsonianum]